MSNVDENEYGSDEDMFSPKKNRSKTSSAVLEPVNRPPGCKERLVNTFKRMLTGVPPPPDYTNPDFHVDKMLTYWKENQNLVWDHGHKRASATTEESLGLCLNEDDSCEELELLGRQICERYIWSETAAVTSRVYVKLTQSAKKRRKANGWGLSPRTRISYLTRRMTTFQRDNIAAAVASNRTTQILVAKNDSKKGSSGKKDFKGKRALFQSPENKNKYRTPEQGKDRKLVRRLLLNSSPQGSDRSKYANGGEGAKSSEKRRCSRSLFSSKAEPVSNHVSTPQNQNHQSNALSTQHRQKMLWAVSNALKAVKIKMTDPEFKTYAGPLFKATTEKWRTSLDSPSGDKKASTSDAMLTAAKSLVERITGRKMSPKSAKKNPTLRMRIKTPDKSEKRDENNPPSVLNPATSIISMEKDSGDGGVFPLEHGVLAEKLDPGGNTYSINFQIMNRKRKLEDDRDTTEISSILVSPHALRMRTPSKTTGLTPKKLTFHPSVVHGTSKQSNDSPLAKKRKLASSETPTKIEAQLLRKRTPSKVDSTVGVMGHGGTPKKTRLSPLKLPHVPENSRKNNATPRKSQKEPVEILSPRLPRKKTPTEIPVSLEINRQRVTPRKLRSTASEQPSAQEDEEICTDRAPTPNKLQKEAVEMVSPRVLRTRTPTKITESLEINCQRITPMKLRSTPPKLPTSSQTSTSTLENEKIFTDSGPTPPKSNNEIKRSTVSPRVLRTRTPSRVTSSSEVCSSKSTPKKVLFAPFDEKVDYSSFQEETIRTGVLKSQKEAVEIELVSPRVLRTRTPTKIPVSPNISYQRVTPKKLRSTPSNISLAQKNEEICKDDAPQSSMLQKEAVEIELVSPRVLRTRTPTKIPVSPNISYQRVTPKKLRSTSSNLSLAQKNEEICKDGAPQSSISGDEGSVDQLPPVLRPQNLTVRRSSRRCSTENPPPVLKMEISDISPPPLILEE